MRDLVNLELSQYPTIFNVESIGIQGSSVKQCIRLDKSTNAIMLYCMLL